jgi:hypothetical protein
LQLVLQGALVKVEVLNSRVDWEVKIAGVECLEDCGELVGICGQKAFYIGDPIASKSECAGAGGYLLRLL